MAPPAPAGPSWPITFDTDALWFKYYKVTPDDSGPWLDTDKVKTIWLTPGTHAFLTGSGQTPAFTLTVTGDGKVHYDPGDRSFLSGAGTSTLTLKGVPRRHRRVTDRRARCLPGAAPHRRHDQQRLDSPPDD